ncbi:MAG: hypothetical protein ACJ8KA_10215 [Sulfurifustis sp.]
MKTSKSVATCLVLALALCACGGGGGGGSSAGLNLRVAADTKQLIFRWNRASGVTSYRLLQNADGVSGFTQIGADLPADATSTTLDIAVQAGLG